MKKSLDVDAVAGLPGVQSVVAAHSDGAVAAFRDEPDAESVAAVVGFVMGMIASSGEAVGFGKPTRIDASGAAGQRVFLTHSDSFWAVRLSPNQRRSVFDEALDKFLNSSGRGDG